MNIIDIVNHEVKASKGSITVKQNNKTFGVVNGLTRFKDLQANKQFTYHRKLREAGVWGNNKINLDNCYILNDEIYLLKNLRSCICYSEEEQINFDDMYIKISKYGINVIECYVI